ncbi:unnamed protein product [Leuciscus chuanchicus]
MELQADGMEKETVAGLKRRMSAEGTNTKLPRRARNPPKKMRLYEPDPSSPRDNQDGGEHLEAFRSFLDKVEQIQPQAGVWAPKGRSRQQELYPGSGLFLSSTHLAAIHATAKKDCLRLFHLLFDEFFTAEECQNAVAFGKHGKVPDGKRVLDKFKVNAILTYVMRCSTLDGWTPVEKTTENFNPCGKEHATLTSLVKGEISKNTGIMHSPWPAYIDVPETQLVINYGLDDNRKLRDKGSSDLPSVGHRSSNRVFSEEQEKVLAEYLTQAADLYYGLAPREVRTFAYELAVKYDLKYPQRWGEKQMAGPDWFTFFMKRNPNLSLRSPEATSLSRATSFNHMNVERFFNSLGQVIKRSNFDGTHLGTASSPPTYLGTTSSPPTYLVTSGSSAIQNITMSCAPDKPGTSGLSPGQAFSPSAMRPFPKAGPRKTTGRIRKKRRSKILTDTPVKQALMEEQQGRGKKRQSIVVLENVIR